MAGMIDTNILLYAANRDAEQHAAAASFLCTAAETAEPWFLTDGILYEFLRVSTHPHPCLKESERHGQQDRPDKAPNDPGSDESMTFSRIGGCAPGA